MCRGTFHSYRYGGGLVCGLEAAGCVDVHFYRYRWGGWLILWIGCCWLCRGSFYVGTGVVVV
jgi:hypothetical protein